MRNRASSSRTDPRPWYRDRWPWLLIAGPVAVVVASLVSAWIAAASDDGVVAQDYYKQGLLINRKLKLVAAAPAREPGATIALSHGGELHVRLEGVAQPARLELKLSQPGGHDLRIIVFTAAAEAEWIGTLPELGTGRRIVTLESEAWRMPVTTTAVPFSEIRLGAAAEHAS
jgi:hypothetical protein